MIAITINPTETIDQAMDLALDVAKRSGQEVSFLFNGLALKAYPVETTVQGMTNQYNYLMAKRAAKVRERESNLSFSRGLEVGYLNGLKFALAISDVGSAPREIINEEIKRLGKA